MRFVLNLLLAYAAQQWKNCGITQNRIQHQNFRPQAALQHMQYFCAGINDCACLNGIIGFCIQADHLALGCITVCSAVTRSTSFSSVILVSPTGARHHIRSPCILTFFRSFLLRIWFRYSAACVQHFNLPHCAAISQHICGLAGHYGVFV